MANSAGETPNKLAPETYAGYGIKVAPNWLMTRTADKQAAFLLPHLRPGMDLLDCGCGPGSITLGLAKVVAPGQTVGIDIDASQISRAQQLAVEQQASTVRFEAATIYQLPFPDGSFDAVFSNTVFTYLDEPLRALREIQRVLKTGGLVGIRVADFDGHLFAPSYPILRRFFQLFAGIGEQRGGSFYLGKELPSLLHQTEFVNVQASASYECYGTKEAIKTWGTVMVQGLHDETFVGLFRQQDMAQRELEEMRQAWQDWSENPAAFFAESFGEVVGWKA